MKRKPLSVLLALALGNTANLSAHADTVETAGTGIAIVLPAVAAGIAAYKQD